MEMKLVLYDSTFFFSTLSSAYQAVLRTARRSFNGPRFCRHYSYSHSRWLENVHTTFDHSRNMGIICSRSSVSCSMEVYNSSSSSSS